MEFVVNNLEDFELLNSINYGDSIHHEDPLFESSNKGLIFLDFDFSQVDNISESIVNKFAKITFSNVTNWNSNKFPFINNPNYDILLFSDDTDEFIEPLITFENIKTELTYEKEIFERICKFNFTKVINSSIFSLSGVKELFLTEINNLDLGKNHFPFLIKLHIKKCNFDTLDVSHFKNLRSLEIDCCENDVKCIHSKGDIS